MMHGDVHFTAATVPWISMDRECRRHRRVPAPLDPRHGTERFLKKVDLIRMHTALAVATFLVMPAIGASAQTGQRRDRTLGRKGRNTWPGIGVRDRRRARRDGARRRHRHPVAAAHRDAAAIVTMDGKTVTFQARTDQVFRGALSDDGVWIVGEFSIQGFTPPFTLKNVGPARMPAPLTSAPISRELAGRWVGALEADGRRCT